MLETKQKKEDIVVKINDVEEIKRNFEKKDIYISEENKDILEEHISSNDYTRALFGK
ncbi:MAG: hypothetical protein PHE52_02655 [Candidatus Pacebacteria bacterium]|nr:hypothetical protein [Candidatus Paceibacterota bacterium]